MYEKEINITKLSNAEVEKIINELKEKEMDELGISSEETIAIEDIESAQEEMPFDWESK
ncbi:hypothetical protein [Dialister micraerophilus]|uniref:hypothetical protein n=1 Tax=Dialister micraerophilus TaxID=309120 RepID=UPI0023EFBD99|nr:hypothetical protein [Dialister micraerophilus]